MVQITLLTINNDCFHFDECFAFGESGTKINSDLFLYKYQNSEEFNKQMINTMV